MNVPLELAAALIPLITAFIKKELAEKGTMPTDEEVLASLTSEEDKVLAISDAYLSGRDTGDETSTTK